MSLSALHRCLEAWQSRVLRRQQLEGLLLQGLAMSEQMAAKSAFRGWHEVRALPAPCTGGNAVRTSLLVCQHAAETDHKTLNACNVAACVKVCGYSTRNCTHVWPGCGPAMCLRVPVLLSPWLDCRGVSDAGVTWRSCRPPLTHAVSGS